MAKQKDTISPNVQNEGIKLKNSFQLKKQFDGIKIDIVGQVQSIDLASVTEAEIKQYQIQDYFDLV